MDVTEGRVGPTFGSGEVSGVSGYVRLEKSRDWSRGRGGSWRRGRRETDLQARVSSISVPNQSRTINSEGADRA